MNKEEFIKGANALYDEVVRLTKYNDELFNSRLDYIRKLDKIKEYINKENIKFKEQFENEYNEEIIRINILSIIDGNTNE